MSDDQLKLHIVLNDEVIDLRQESTDKRSVKTRSPYRTTSQQLISESSRSGLTSREPLHVNGLKKLASNLCYGPTTSILQKNKNALRYAKPRTRATSADPRFRRERSPVHQTKIPAEFTQSDSQVSEVPKEGKKNKTQSDSTFVLNRQLPPKKSPSSKISKLIDNRPEAIRKRHDFPVSPFVLENSEELHRADILKKDNGDRISSVKCSATTSQNYSFETLGPSIAEQSTMTEEVTGPLDGKSNYQTAVTDVNGTARNDMEVYNTTVGYHCDKTRELSPYWDDPRLIEKYSKLLKPVQIRKSKSSWTLPLAISKRTPSSPGSHTCTKCSCTNQTVQEHVSYKVCPQFVQRTLRYESTKSKLYSAMYKNYYLTILFLLGSLCGLTLVAFVVWVLANDLLWTYVSRSQEVQKYTGLRWFTAYVGGGIIYGLNFAFSKLYQMIIMPRNEVFDPLKTETTWSFF